MRSAVSAHGGSRRAWGWHWLVDEWAARVVAEAAVRPGDLVVDIGAGEGALTAHLVRAGARVIAVELHPRRARRLRERFAGAPVQVVLADAVTGWRLPSHPFRVVANPPYGMSSALVRVLLAPRSRLVAADLVLQRAAVRRLADRASAGRSGYRGYRGWSLTAGRPVPRRAFRPPPQVDSAVLLIRRR